MGIRIERWLIKPLTCPRPIRHCSTCGVAKEFVCSERFRINAQKKVLDVWLHYRCGECGGAWKLPVLERLPVGALDAAAYESYVRHDRLTVWKHAFDIDRIRTHVMQVDANVSFAIERSVVDNGGEDELCIHFEVPFPCGVRLDRLLSVEMGVSRSTIQRWHESGLLHVLPEQSGALSKRARTGQRLLLSGIAAAARESG